ncbi:MAG: VIT1/CCC1 transporter family protein, partial [Bacteroidota bacterium]
VGGNALRAAVLGGNDGLVSNFSLVMGIAGATSGQSEVLLAGLAGLLAGALSMALGEWISVKSSQELYENQMDLEMEELETNPEGEEKELALIYITKGIPEAQAIQMAKEIMLDKGQAHEILVREELGINVDEMKGSAMEAAVTSFVLFAVGAILPVIPFFFVGGMMAILFSATLSAIGLFIIGAAITLFTGKNVLFSGFRQVAFGLIAAAITFGIGHFIGISIAG